MNIDTPLHNNLLESALRLFKEISAEEINAVNRNITEGKSGVSTLYSYYTPLPGCNLVVQTLYTILRVKVLYNLQVGSYFNLEEVGGALGFSSLTSFRLDTEALIISVRYWINFVAS